MVFVRVLAVIALAFLSLSALYGSVVVIMNAHGNPWGLMPLSLLQYSPFHSWLIPGIILLTANGLLGLWVLSVVLAHSRNDGLWAILQGCVLIGWLTVECVMLRTVIWPHYMYGAVGLALILLGALLRRDSRTQVAAH